VKRFTKIAGCTLLYLLAFDVVGVILCFLLDVVSSDGSNTIEYYVIWFVLGVFCGIFGYNSCGSIASAMSNPQSNQGHTIPNPANQSWKNRDWTAREDAAQTGLFVIFTTAVVLFALAIPFYVLHWGQGTQPSGYVPDSGPLTITFFATVLASTIFAHKSFRPEPPRPEQKQIA
jgi:H+/Cl- antiporter ClcA